MVCVFGFLWVWYNILGNFFIENEMDELRCDNLKIGNRLMLTFKNLKCQLPDHNDFTLEARMKRTLFYGLHQTFINLWTKNEDFALNRKSNSSYLFDSKYSTIVVSRTSNRDSYMGQNAYGAKTKISSTQMNEYGLAIANGKQAPDTEIFSYSIPVKLREARALKDDISFYAEVNLIDVNQTSSGELTGDVLKSVFVRKATISEPSESFMTGKYLLAYIKEIGVYKKSTGEVLGWKKFE